jgi:hypothetical protein
MNTLEYLIALLTLLIEETSQLMKLLVRMVLREFLQRLRILYANSSSLLQYSFCLQEY